MIKIKRIYESCSKSDGFRILIDRIWPRGIKKETAKIDLWLKDIAPSNELRKWFSHDRKKYEEFKLKYIKELEKNKKELSVILKLAVNNDITLLYSTKDDTFNNAVILCEYLKKFLI